MPRHDAKAMSTRKGGCLWHKLMSKRDHEAAKGRGGEAPRMPRSLLLAFLLLAASRLSDLS